MKLLRNLLRSACYRSYGAAQWYEARDERRLPRRKQPVIVHQMGKVGSVTVCRSITAQGAAHPFHTHFLSPGEIRRTLEEHAPVFPAQRKIPDHLRNSLLLRRQLDLGRIDERWKVVTLIRDPLARKFSGFFQTVDHVYPELEFARKVQTVPPEELIEELESVFRRWSQRYVSPEAWLDEELKGVFGVDVMGEEFPVDRGYWIYNGGRVPVLLIKLEWLNDCAGEAFREFMGLEGLTLVRGNEASSKQYAGVYDLFRKRRAVEDHDLSRIYDSPFVRHFYSTPEIDGFRDRWAGRLDRPTVAAR